MSPRYIHRIEGLLSASELRQVVRAAEIEGLSIIDYVRGRLGFPPVLAALRPTGAKARTARRRLIHSQRTGHLPPRRY
jgi:hypothetical protein